VVSPQPKEAIGSPAYFALLRSMTAQERLIEAGIGIARLPESSVHEELRLGTLATPADNRSDLRALSQKRVFDRCRAHAPYIYSNQ
jgi:DNA-binding transcriptional LysR family regulator